MSVNAVIPRLAELANIGRHEGGIDRGLATPQEHAARERFAAWGREAGYTITQDIVGNLFARRAGTRAGALPILVGSHLDTVPTGGAYDGAYGVVGAICSLEFFDERNTQTTHPVEAVAWAGEEGSRFPLGCLGSSVFSGITNAQTALVLTDMDGTSLHAALASTHAGLLNGVPMRESLKPSAYLELHVEQGPVLERECIPLGVVTAIAGQCRYRITVEGESGHAGTVPMDLRSDALCAGADLVLTVESAARTIGNVVATIGRMTVEPGATNVIPLRATFSLDVRSPEASRIRAVDASLRDGALRMQCDRGVRVDIEQLEARAFAPMDARMRQAVHRAIASLNMQAIDLPSGAGHDAMCLSQIAPAAMIFVPSIGGRSHVGDERTAEADLRRGVEALAAAIVEVDRMLESN